MKVRVKVGSYSNTKQSRFSFLENRIFNVEGEKNFYMLTAVDDDVNEKLKAAFPYAASLGDKIQFPMSKESCEIVLKTKLDKILEE